MTQVRGQREGTAQLSLLSDSLQSVSRMKLKGGVVGRLAIVGVVALLAIPAVLFAAGLWPRGDTIVLAAVGAIVLICVVIAAGILWYAFRNPETALMEGAEILVNKRLQIETKLGNIDAALMEPSIDEAMPAGKTRGQATDLDEPQSPARLPEGRTNG